MKAIVPRKYVMAQYALCFLKARTAYLREVGDYFLLVFGFEVCGKKFKITLNRAMIEYGCEHGWLILNHNVNVLRTQGPGFIEGLRFLA